MLPDNPREIQIADITIGGNRPMALIAGPCVLEKEELTLQIAQELKQICAQLNVPLIFKASFDKANRTSVSSYRGLEIEKGLEILSKVKQVTGLPLISDVHEVWQVDLVAPVLDVLQIPALLSRQTDLIVAAAASGKAVHIKKGQFMAPQDMIYTLNKATSTGNHNILLGERGTTFGYNNLVVDMRSLPIMRRLGYPVVFDATHSVQLPSMSGGVSGGQREWVSYLSRAAVAIGIDVLFWEVHPNPDQALCDGPNSLVLSQLYPLLSQLVQIDNLVKK
ncbi:MAG: 3-deoxy-8-phosphooctulonate synthase [Candidatus Schekmanbacteria bacterium]|nr:3-deoxy-8-phosphooctulonate synthase [Candidatus Schekmanbacteria bacterium]